MKKSKTCVLAFLLVMWMSVPVFAMGQQFLFRSHIGETLHVYFLTPIRHSPSAKSFGIFCYLIVAWFLFLFVLQCILSPIV